MRKRFSTLPRSWLRDAMNVSCLVAAVALVAASTGCAGRVAQIANDGDAEMALRQQLHPLLGKPGLEIARTLALPVQSCSLIDEPPMILRGASLTWGGTSLTLFIAPGEPHYREFMLDKRPSCEAVLQSRMDGLLVATPRAWVGEGVPFQWR